MKRTRRGAPKRYGPDLIHIGVLLLMIGGLISFTGRLEEYLRLAEGESVLLPSGHQILLASFERSSYPDGRPKDYVSRVQVFKEGSIEKTKDIRVNRPLSLNGIKVYQDSFTVTPTLILLDEDHSEYSVGQGEYFRIKDRFFSFRGVTTSGDPRSSSSEGGLEQYDRSSLTRLQSSEQSTADTGEYKEAGRILSGNIDILIQEYAIEGNPVGMHILSILDRIDGFTISGVLLIERTGLRVVKDRSFALVLVSFTIIGCGLALTFIQKQGDKTL